MLGIGPRKRAVYLTPHDLFNAEGWIAAGFTEAHAHAGQHADLRHPGTRRADHRDQVACMGCLSACRFSNWSQHEPDFDNGKKADPRSFCIQKTLQQVRRDDQTPDAIEHQLMFSGHNAYRFAQRPVLLQRLHPHREAARRPHPLRPVSRALTAALLLPAAPHPPAAADPVFSPVGPDAAAYGAPAYPLGTRATVNRPANHGRRLLPLRPLSPPTSSARRHPRPPPPRRRRNSRSPTPSGAPPTPSTTTLRATPRPPCSSLPTAPSSSNATGTAAPRRPPRSPNPWPRPSPPSSSASPSPTAASAPSTTRRQTYATALTHTLYGETPLRALLTMSSGVAFREDYTDPTADNTQLGRDLLRRNSPGPAAALARLHDRAAPPGTRFNYAGADTEALGLVLRAATGMSLADYLSARFWQPMGAEADANWSTDATGQELAYCCLSATARDWARLGLLMANDGAANGQPLVPRAWITADDHAPTADYLAPGRATRFDGYGYQTWLLPGNRGACSPSAASTARPSLWTRHQPRPGPHRRPSCPNRDPATAELAALWQAAVAQQTQ